MSVKKWEKVVHVTWYTQTQTQTTDVTKGSLMVYVLMSLMVQRA